MSNDEGKRDTDVIVEEHPVEKQQAVFMGEATGAPGMTDEIFRPRCRAVATMVGQLSLTSLAIAVAVAVRSMMSFSVVVARSRGPVSVSRLARKLV